MLGFFYPLISLATNEYVLKIIVNDANILQKETKVKQKM